MMDLDSLLRQSAVPSSVAEAPGVSAELDALVEKIVSTAPRRRWLRRGIVAAILIGAVSLGAGATATAQSIWPDLLGGQADASTVVTIARPGQADEPCEIGVRVLPDTGYSVRSAVYQNAVHFLRSHDWAHLRPEASLDQFTPEFARAHKIPFRPVIATTVLTQITDAMQKAGVFKRGIIVHGVVDCGLEAKK
jgi:hypothetical protein